MDITFLEPENSSYSCSEADDSGNQGDDTNYFREINNSIDEADSNSLHNNGNNNIPEEEITEPQELMQPQDSDNDQESVESNEPRQSQHLQNGFSDNEISETEAPVEPPDPEEYDVCQVYPRKLLIRFLIVLATKMRHNGTYVAAEHYSEMIEAMNDSGIKPLTTYHIKKLMRLMSTSISICHFCSSCQSYAGKQIEMRVDIEDDPTEFIICRSCHTQVDLRRNWSAGNTFIHISLTAQLKELFERYGDSILYSKTRMKQSEYAIEDIYDGEIYKRNFSEDMISINFGFDGVPVFESSNYSMHPVLCTINELEPRKRPVFMMLCSLYTGSGNVPNVKAYLTPFIEECNELYESGFNYTHDGKLYHKKCRILCGICDSVARPTVRMCHQFNGAYGCGFCKHPGEQVEKGRGTVRVYPVDAGGNPFGEGIRTHDETFIHAENLEKGIQGESILFQAKGVDVIKGLPPEWLHSVGLGVLRQFANLWFDSTHKDEPFYCRQFLAQVDELILSFKPSLEVSRTPRPMSDRTHWKAHEWVIFLLCYSIPILKRMLPAKYVQHWALLLEGIFILIGTSIMPSQVYYAHNCLTQFVQGVVELYGKQYVSYNVHLLTHLADSVLDLGPLWAHSAYGYENYNQFLQNFVHSSNSPSLQVCNSFRLQYVVHKLYDICLDALNEKQINYLNKLLLKKTYPRVTLELREGSLLGAGEVSKISEADFLALQRININVSRNCIVRYYKKIILNHEIIHSSSYTRPFKRQSFFVILKNSEIFEIQKFVVIEHGVSSIKCYAIGHYFQKSNRPLVSGRRLNHLIVLENKIPHLASVPIELIDEKVVFVQMPQCRLFLACKHPNHFELLT